jgi:CHAT domain-containing protein
MVAASDNFPPDLVELGNAWLDCPTTEEGKWLTIHQTELTLQLLEYLKACNDQLWRNNPQASEQLTKKMLTLAAYMPNEPLAHPLACWARGMWALEHHPEQAVQFFRQALAGYRPTSNAQCIVRLLSNLAGAMIETDPTGALAVYAEIPLWQDRLTEADRKYLITAKQNYGILLRRMGRYQEALAVHQEALQLAYFFAQMPLVMQITNNLLLTLVTTGEITRCESLLLQNRSLAQSLDERSSLARIELNLGELYTALARPSDALKSLQRARQLFTALNNQMEIGSVAMNEAALFERIGNLVQARRHYAQAEQHFTAFAMFPQVGKALVQGAIVNRRFGEFAQAATLLQRAEQLWQAQGHSGWLYEIQLEQVALSLAQEDITRASSLLASMDKSNQDANTPRLHAGYALLQGQLNLGLWQQRKEEKASLPVSEAYQAKALAAYQTVLAYAQAQEDRLLHRDALVGLAQLHWPLQPDIAIRYLEEAVEQADLIRAALNLQELKASFLVQSSDLLPQLAHWAIEQDNPMQALAYAWRAKGSAFIELIQNLQEQSLSVAYLTEEIRQIRDELATVRWRNLREQAVAINAQPLLEERNPQIRQLEERLLALRRQRLHHEKRLTKDVVLQPDRFLGQMAADWLIEYIQYDQDLLAICADQHGHCIAYRLAATDDLLDLLDELSLAFQSVLTLPLQQRSQPFLLAEAQRLLARGYDLLIRPLSCWQEGAKLLIAPCAPIYQIPFAALWDGKQYLAERHLIELTPTAALLAIAAPTAPLTHPLVITSSAEGKLPNTRAEAVQLQALYPKATCLSDDPNALGYLRQLKVAPSFIHFSAHMLPPREEMPIFTALQLTGGVLSVEECYDLPVEGAELVTLSSCTSNLGMDNYGSLLAFQSAFLIAGAKRVVSTLWAVDNLVTPDWVKIFYTHLAAGLAPHEAVRKTQLTFLAQEQLCHPALWAAFVCSRR